MDGYQASRCSGEGGTWTGLLPCFHAFHGGLVFAEAVRRHIIDNPLRRWRVAGGTPWYGSPLATAARRISESDDDPRRLLLRDVGQCDTKHGQVPRTLLQLTDTSSLKVLRDWMLSNGTTGAEVTLCGNNPWGSSDWFGLEYSAIVDLFGVSDELTTHHGGVVPLTLKSKTLPGHHHTSKQTSNRVATMQTYRVEHTTTHCVHCMA